MEPQFSNMLKSLSWRLVTYAIHLKECIDTDIDTSACVVKACTVSIENRKRGRFGRNAL